MRAHFLMTSKENFSCWDNVQKKCHNYVRIPKFVSSQYELMGSTFIFNIQCTLSTSTALFLRR